MIYNKPNNLLLMSHTNPEEIIMDKVSVGPKGLVKYSHPKYGKSHVLVLRLGIFTLDKYPIDNYSTTKTPDEKNPVNLKIPIDESFVKTPSYEFIQNILGKYGYKSNGKFKYPVFDSENKSNYLKIKNMDLFQYPITEIINTDFKIKTINHKPTSVADLKNIFKQNLQVVPYVMVYYHKMPNGDFVTLKPVRFYIGKNISMEQIDFINNQTRHVEVPKSDYYDCNQNARPVSIIDFIKSIQTEAKDVDVNDIFLTD